VTRAEALADGRLDESPLPSLAPCRLTSCCPSPRVLPPPGPGPNRGAARFVRGLGEAGRDFAISLSGTGAEVAAAEERITGCDPLIAFEDNGLLDHRRRYPEDSMLALWSGLALKGQGRPALAAALR